MTERVDKFVEGIRSKLNQVEDRLAQAKNRRMTFATRPSPMSTPNWKSFGERRMPPKDRWRNLHPNKRPMQRKSKRKPLKK